MGGEFFAPIDYRLYDKNQAFEFNAKVIGEILRNEY